ncbi:MAG: hypothetical protein WKG07_43185 [Hymenobacter sp.]
MAISWSQYLLKFLEKYGLHLPPQLVRSPFETATLASGAVVHGYANVPAMLVVLAITAVIIRGTSGLGVVQCPGGGSEGGRGAGIHRPGLEIH